MKNIFAEKAMNRMIIVSSFLIFLFCLSCKQKEIQGLVADYSFSGNALDESGNGNHGIVFDAQLTSDRFGNKNSAYYLDGASAYILATVSKMPSVERPQTISLWFMIHRPPAYSDSLGAYNMIALVDSPVGIGVQFGYRAPAYNTLGLDAWYWGGRTVLESQQPTVKEWHHCVYTYDGQKHLFYLDGKQTAQSTVKPQVGIPNILMLGNYPGGNQYFEGSLDDVRIYKRTLTPSEIMLLYNMN